MRYTPSMGSCSAPSEPINQYGLVTYLPGELGCYLDQLRRDLVSQCNARSHISLLPPRSLDTSPSQAESQIRSLSLLAQPIVVKIGKVCVFPGTSVIFLELEAGQSELVELHSKFSADALAFDEPFPFHPHITLAQNFEIGTVDERIRQAQMQWDAYTGPREFLLDRVVFVQNSANNCWIDLKTFSLEGLPVAPNLTSPMRLSRTY